MKRREELTQVLGQALSSCMDGWTPQTNKNKKFEEPDYTAGIALNFTEKMNKRAADFGLKFSGCFVHQSPKCFFTNNSNNVSCEAGDLLLICKDTTDATVKYNSVLFQLKMADREVVTITQVKPLRQLRLYTEWPEFSLGSNKQKKFSIEPKTPTQGAMYTFVHEKKGDDGVLSFDISAAAKIMTTTTENLADFIVRFINFENGRTFAEESKATDEWTKFIWELINQIKDKNFKRRNISDDDTNRYNRHNGNFLELLSIERCLYGSLTANISGAREVSANELEDPCIAVVFIEKGSRFNCSEESWKISDMIKKSNNKDTCDSEITIAAGVLGCKVPVSTTTQESVYWQLRN